MSDETTTTIESHLDVPFPPGVTSTDDDPCDHGLTLIYLLPCTASTPTMAQWCARTDLDHTVTDGIDSCAAFTQRPAVLPSTGDTTTVVVGGMAMALVLAGMVVLRWAR